MNCIVRTQADAALRTIHLKVRSTCGRQDEATRRPLSSSFQKRARIHMPVQTTQRLTSNLKEEEQKEIDPAGRGPCARSVSQSVLRLVKRARLQQVPAALAIDT